MDDKKISIDHIGLNIQDAIILMDPRGTISYWNQMAETLFGWSHTEALGKNLHELIAPKRYHESFINSFDHFLKSGEGPAINKVLDVSAIHKDGHEFSIELTLGAVIINDQWHAIGVIRDVALKKQLEFQLLHAERIESIGTLAGGFAHEFNNILASIIGYTELALDDAHEGTLIYSNLNEVLTAGNRARDLICQVLKFSRQIESLSEPVHMKTIITDALKMVRSSFPRSIDIHMDLQSEGMILADPSRIHQMILNLCTNAGYAMGDQGTLTVSLEDVDDLKTVHSSNSKARPGNYIKFSISDTGKGMTPDILSRAFTPFFTTKEQGKGSGMGLSQVHGVVYGLNGWINPKSEPGKGSTFDIYLPAMEKKDAAHSIRKKNLTPRTGCILFVDDEEPVVRMGKQLIEQMGYTVEALTSSLEALEHFKRTPDAYDLVITDLTMPDMNGMAMASAMTLIRPDIPIILSTGYGMTHTDQEIREAGIDVVVFKPLLSNQIAETIGRLLTS